MKKIFIYILTVITIINAFCIPASAKDLTLNDLDKMSDYDYYCAFAEALKNHDSYTLSLFIACCSKYHGLKCDGQFERLKTCKEAGCTAYKQFDSLKKIKIKKYSVKLLENPEMSYRPAAKITLMIDKGDNNLFPKGKNEYYVYLDRKSGIDGIFIFRPFDQKNVNYKEKYKSLFSIF